MIRKIIVIDEKKCNGCGLCVDACHEGAIGIIDGKARLLHDDYCDGLGDCLPVCPTEAITFEEREAEAYDEEAVRKNMGKSALAADVSTSSVSVPGASVVAAASHLNRWPIQIKLMPVRAPYFDGADLLVSADCAAYTYGAFHGKFMRDKVTLIGCPKLDEGDYSEKLTAIMTNNNIASVTVVRMEVPCCGGIESAARKALQNSGKTVPLQVVTFSVTGKILQG
ncbi:MAG: 4Fe-4S binding protein [Coriobacteriia bacterium]|nr:4Fe-4S binding protein [Coriobacteriia bacterium]